MVAGLATVLGVWMSATAPSSVFVAEVAYDIVGSEPDGEWVELINMDDGPVPLDELRLADEETIGGNEAVLAFPTGTILGPRQVIVVAVSAAAFQTAWGTLPDFEIKSTVASVPHLTADRTLGGTQFQLANTSDEVLLLDSVGAIVDGVSWGRSPALTGVPNTAISPEGRTLVRTFDLGGPPRPWGVGTPSPFTASVIGLNADGPGQSSSGNGTTDPPVEPPTDPVDPVDPDPVDPTDPTDPPPDPVDPVEPDPVEPDPVDPEEPVDPVEPAEPEEPAGPPENDTGSGVDLGDGRGGFSGPVTPEADGGCAALSPSSTTSLSVSLVLLGLLRRRRR